MSSRIYYGWVVVASAFAITFAGFGAAYTFPAFVLPLEQEFGASRGSISLVFSLAGFLYFGLGVISGPLADRWGARRLAIGGMLMVAAGLMLAGMARTLTEIYLAYGLGVGLGVGCAYVPVLGTVQKWFDRRRSLASGLAVSGIGVGTLVMPPLASMMIDDMGWRNAYIALGILVAIVGTGMAALISDSPQAAKASGERTGVTPSAPSGQPVGLKVGEAVRTPAFRHLYIACLICAFGVFVPFVHLVPYALDRAIDAASATLLIALIGAGSTIGRFFLGGIADRVGRGRFLAMLYAGMALAMGLWAVSGTFAPLALFALVFGLFYGGWVAILPSVVMDRFGGANVSGIIGILYTSVAFGTLIGPTAAGYMFDASGSYALPIIVSIVANIAAAAITFLSLRSRNGIAHSRA